MFEGGTNFIRSPSLLAWVIFWIYLLLAGFGLYYLVNMFKQERIIYGHLNNLFQILTRVRVWSIRYRKTYTIVITTLLSVSFLVTVYLSETLHSILFGSELAFGSFVDYLRWITIFVISGLQVGEYPQSFLAFILSGVFPLFIIGSIFTIVRLTSESAHEALVKRMAEGGAASYRVIIFNYREEYDQFINSLLDQSDAFVIVFAKEEHIQDANSFVEGIEQTDIRDYRVAIEELSYSEDVLFGKYSILESDELYVFPDVESRTDYENLRLITRLNNIIKTREQNPSLKVDSPETIWIADKQKLSGVAQNLEETEFKQRLHAMTFQEDVRDLIRANTGDTLPELEKYFNFTQESTAPSWIEGFSLNNYKFVSSPLKKEEVEKTDDLREHRLNISRDKGKGIQQSKLTELRNQTIKKVETRLRNEDTESMGLLFGLIADVAGSKIPITRSSAYSQQIETATDAIQVQKNGSEKNMEAEIGSSEGNIFIVNYNSKIREFSTSFDTYESDKDRYLTVFTSETQVTPKSTERTNFVEYRSINDLLEMMFNETERSPRKVEPGDTIILLLDYTIPKPKVNILRALDAIDNVVESNSTNVDHNDIFLCVESDSGSRKEEYRYLSVDKILETQRTQHNFLHNLAQIRTSDTIEEMIKEGRYTQEQAFAWAVNSAYYFREFRIDSCQQVHQRGITNEPIVGKSLGEIADDKFEQGNDVNLPLTTFSLQRDDEEVVLSINEFEENHTVLEDEFLISLPRV